MATLPPTPGGSAASASGFRPPGAPVRAPDGPLGRTRAVLLAWTVAFAGAAGSACGAGGSGNAGAPDGGAAFETGGRGATGAAGSAAVQAGTGAAPAPGSGGGVPVGIGGGAGGGVGGAAGASSGSAGGCVWTLGTGQEVAGPPPTKNNSADLRGPAIGDVAFASSTGRRVVPVSLGATIAGVTVGQAYLTEASPTADTVEIAIPVTNQGTDYPCFLQATNLQYLAANKAMLNSATDTLYVDGSVGDLGGDLYTHSCLAPGETGYLLDSRKASFFSAIVALALDLNATASGQAPAGHLTPKQYELGTCGASRSLRMTAVNDGLSTVTVAPGGLGLGPVVLFDGDGLPAGWIFLEDDVSAQLAPGGSAIFTSELPGVAAVTRAQFFVDFDPPAAAALTLDPPQP